MIKGILKITLGYGIGLLLLGVPVIASGILEECGHKTLGWLVGLQGFIGAGSFVLLAYNYHRLRD